MRPRHAVSKNPRGIPLTARANCSNFLRITSLADSHSLTPIESHPYKKGGGGGTFSPRPPVFRTFFQVPYPPTPVFSHSSQNCRGVPQQFPEWNISARSERNQRGTCLIFKFAFSIVRAVNRELQTANLFFTPRRLRLRRGKAPAPGRVPWGDAAL